MNKLLLLLAMPVLLNSCNAQNSNNKPFEKIAVIELFTSEGCSSCPPADALLAQYNKKATENGVKIFPLSFHVDYWNRLGWKDPFSSSEYSDRQSMYANVMNLNSVYTPQMIVNGTEQFVGSDEDALQKALAGTRTNNAISITGFKLLKDDAGTKASYMLEGDTKGYSIHVAVVSKYESTVVRRGENGGRTLPHTNVVRSFYTAPAAASGEMALGNLPADLSNTLVIAYLQNTHNLHIIAAISAQP